jgi:hypothetical protein
MFTKIPSRGNAVLLGGWVALSACGGGGTDMPGANAQSPVAAEAPVPAAAIARPEPTAGAATLSALSALASLPPLPALAAAIPAGTLSYAVQVSRRDTDLYELEGNLGFVETQRCPELAQATGAILTMAGLRGLLSFPGSGMDCRVLRYYARAALSAGSYQSTVGWRRSDWYSLTDSQSNESYRARTAACTEVMDPQPAQVTIDAAQRGSFGMVGAAGLSTCQVVQLYVLTVLP